MNSSGFLSVPACQFFAACSVIPLISDTETSVWPLPAKGDTVEPGRDVAAFALSVHAAPVSPSLNGMIRHRVKDALARRTPKAPFPPHASIWTAG